SPDHLSKYSCVRALSASVKCSSISLIRCGSSNNRRMYCSPECEARQPGPSSDSSAGSIGNFLSSEVTSTRAVDSKSNQWCVSFVGTGTIYSLVKQYFAHFVGKYDYRCGFGWLCAFDWLAHSRNSILRLFTEASRSSGGGSKNSR